MQEQTINALITLIDILWLPTLLLALAFISANSWIREYIGRTFVNLMARKGLDDESYYLIKNVSLPTEEGSVQINHVIVSAYGVFVVETVSVKGWVYGSPHNQSWIQETNRRKYKFPNPLLEINETSRNLANLLGLYPHQVHPMVIFVSDTLFKSEMPENVTQGMGYLRYIKSKSNEVLAGPQALDIVDAIESGRLANSYATDWQHVRHVQ